MSEATRITAVESVPENGSYLFSVEDAFTNEREAILVPCEEESGVEAWLNDCPHEAQRLDTGRGAAMRDGEIICPKHGSLFDACEGDCGNGPAAGSWVYARGALVAPSARRSYSERVGRPPRLR